MDCSPELHEAYRRMIDANAVFTSARATHEYHQIAVDNVVANSKRLLGLPGWSFAKIGLNAARDAEDAAYDDMLLASAALARARKEYEVVGLAEDIRNAAEWNRAQRAEVDEEWQRAEKTGRQAREEPHRPHRSQYSSNSYSTGTGTHSFGFDAGGTSGSATSGGNYYSTHHRYERPPRSPHSPHSPHRRRRNSYESRYQSRDRRAPSPPRSRQPRSGTYESGYQSRDRRGPSPRRSRQSRSDLPHSEPPRPKPPAGPRISASKLTEWKREADRLLVDRAAMTTFPDLPYAKCDECAGNENGRALKACKCIIELALRNDPAYPASLKKERLRWHPDRFNLCPEARRQTFKAKAEEIFKVVNRLFETEKESREKMK
jgi:hypothetical protein